MSSRDPKPTPVPKNPSELHILVATIGEGVKSLQEQTRQTNELHLPRVERVAVDSRDTAIKLEARVMEIEKKIPHPCEEKTRQAQQDEDIADMKAAKIKHNAVISGLSKFRSYIIASISAVVVLAGGFAVVTRATEATNATNIQTNRSDIDRHEKLHESAPRKSDLDALRRAVSGVPAATADTIKAQAEEAPPTVDSVEDDIEELARDKKSFSKAEVEWLRGMMKRARKRENGGEHR
jgi:hypothetical protein